MAKRRTKSGTRRVGGMPNADVPEDQQLGLMGLNIRDHWKKYRPKMYRELERSRRLKEALLGMAQVRSLLNASSAATL